MSARMAGEELADLAYKHSARYEAEGDPRDLTIFKLAMQLRDAQELAEWARSDRDEWIKWAKTSNGGNR